MLNLHTLVGYMTKRWYGPPKRPYSKPLLLPEESPRELLSQPSREVWEDRGAEQSRPPARGWVKDERSQTTTRTPALPQLPRPSPIFSSCTDPHCQPSTAPNMLSTAFNRCTLGCSLLKRLRFTLCTTYYVYKTPKQAATHALPSP